MVFSSFTFLFMFLPAFLAVYFLSPGRIKNLVALIGSCVFYAWGAPRILPLLLLGCLIDFCLGRQFANASLSAGRKKALLIFGLLLNVSFLAYFKYANFFVAEFNGLLSLSGIPEFSWKKIALPIGISFYTFHKISYLVDVYNGRAQASRNLIDYLLYIALFPQLVAGPILRYYDISEQLRHRRVTLDDFSHGAFRFCVGLGKKILIADEMGKVADNVFHFSAASSPGTVYLWLGLIAYAYQIYFDFSAYSDMAIGLGRMLGFRFLENFNMPYISKNITEFWRRWHISLSNWMRDYLYIPLGGNRVPAWRNYINLWLVFLLSGLWHGASWNFILWGMFHGSFLTFDKLFWLKYSQKLPRVFNVAITFLVIFSWTFSVHSCGSFF
jgi:alginate O-acetyltransferase complex protein AlgI